MDAQTSPTPPAKSVFKGWVLFLCGMCMGAADLVPGISGGTIAFILGFYNQLLESVKTFNADAFKLLLKFQFKAFFNTIAWKFLATLLLGIVLSFVLLATVIHTVLEHEVYRVYLYSAFLGLVLASFWLCICQISEWKKRYMLGLIFGIVVAYLFTSNHMMSESEGDYAIKMPLQVRVPSLQNYDAENQLLTHLSDATLGAMQAKGLIASSDFVYNSEGMILGEVGDLIKPYKSTKIDPWLIFCGMLAICALLLPGISGSYLLNLLGVYPLVIGALADLIQSWARFTLDTDAFYILFSLGIGIVIGGILFARFVSWLLKNYPNFTMALLSGFMIGALRSVWPFWTYEYILLPLKIQKGPQLLLLNPVWPSLLSYIFLIGLFFTLLGFALVFIIQHYAKKTEIRDL